MYLYVTSTTYARVHTYVYYKYFNYRIDNYTEGSNISW